MVGRNKLRNAVACAIAGIAAAGFAAPATAAVTLGETFIPAINCSGPNQTTMQSQSTPPALHSYAASSRGVITSWSYLSGATAPAAIKLKVARVGAVPGTTLFVGDSAAESPSASTLNTYPTRIPVQAGDFIGFDLVSTGVGCGSFTSIGSGYVTSGFSGDPVPGGTASGNDMTNFQLDVSAKLEPDADADGYGDETQDACPTNAAAQGVCPDPLSAGITKHPKAKTTSKSASFEFSSNDPAATFSCSLDGKGFEECVSPRIFKVNRGKHAFQVKASVGTVVTSPAVYTWTVKKKKKKKKHKDGKRAT